ncbi:MAG: hypothetical protein K2W96_16865 [Gemmataceae bacterium]|nr:hypothetical protein [Gemmataceae bacterium]
MINAADITARLRQVPFGPFRLTTSSGESVDITHPEVASVNRRLVTIQLPGVEPPPGHEMLLRLSILHLASIRDLPGTPPSVDVERNGPSS